MSTEFFHSLWQAFMVVAALSLDTFVACFAYGTAKIKVPLGSVLIMNIVCTGLFAASLFAGAFLKPYISPQLVRYLGFSVLLLIGLIKLIGGLIRMWAEKSKDGKQIHFKIFEVNFILQIAGDNTKADKNADKLLSVTEAVSLAVALSIDGLAVGFSVGITAMVPWIPIALTFLLGIASVYAGLFLGGRVAKRLRINLSWLSGLLLIVLAATKLF